MREAPLQETQNTKDFFSEVYEGVRETVRSALQEMGKSQADLTQEDMLTLTIKCNALLQEAKPNIIVGFGITLGAEKTTLMEVIYINEDGVVTVSILDLRRIQELEL